MTPEEIKKLSREYAEFTDLSPIDQLRVKLISKEFLTWVCKTHCIVPKSKVEALHEEIHGEIMCAHDDDDWQSAAHYILDVMPRTFVDIFGKEIFEETEK